MTSTMAGRDRAVPSKFWPPIPERAPGGGKAERPHARDGALEPTRTSPQPLSLPCPLRRGQFHKKAKTTLRAVKQNWGRLHSHN